MARDWRDQVKTGTFGEDYNKDTAPEPMEDLNKFYNRKQRTKDNKLASDCEAEFAPPDRNAEYDNYKSEEDAGPMNTPWARERYGRQ